MLIAYLAYFCNKTGVRMAWSGTLDGKRPGPRSFWRRPGGQQTRVLLVQLKQEGDPLGVALEPLFAIGGIDRSVEFLVRFVPPAAAKSWGRITSRYDIAIPRAACNLAAIAMTAITIGLFVVVPAKMASDIAS